MKNRPRIKMRMNWMRATTWSSLIVLHKFTKPVFPFVYSQFPFRNEYIKFQNTCLELLSQSDLGL